MPSGKKNWGIIKPPPGAVLDWGDPINKGLVGCWLMNEGAGTKVFDISGKNNHGTLTNGPTWTTGKLGQAINLDGSNDYITMGDATALEVNGNSLTICGWFYPTANPSVNNRKFLITKGHGSGYEYESSITGYNSNKVQFTIYNNATGAYKTITSTIVPSLNQWFHFAGVWNAATGLAKIYINAILDGTSSGTNGAIHTIRTAAFEIGRRGDNAEQRFTGKVGGIDVYNRALSETELRRLYTEPFAGILMPRRKVLYVAGADATSFFDGKIVIKSSGTNLLDGKVQIKDVITALLDGKVAIGSVQQDLLDGKLIVKDTSISYLDGKVIVKDIATTLLDGKLEITQGGTDTASLDAKIRIKDALTALVDGKVIVKSTATDILDGKLTIGTGATNLLDGKIQIKDIATALLDGKIQVKSATVSLLDGKIVIADGISSFSSNNQLLIDSIGGKVLQLGNSRINTWNTAGRPSSPKTGTIGLNTQTIALDVFNGSTWKSITLS